MTRTRKLNILLYTDTDVPYGTFKVMIDLGTSLPSDAYQVAFCFANNLLLNKYREGLKGRGYEVYDTQIPNNRIDIRSASTFVALLREKRFDIVHFHLPNAVSCRFAVILAKTFGGSRIALTEHLPGNFLLLPHTLKARLLRFAVNRAADRIIAVSDGVRESLVRFQGVPESKVQTIYNGIHNNGLRNLEHGWQLKSGLGIAPTDKVVGVIAGLNRQKGHDVLLRAAKAVLSEMPDALFLMVGDGEKKEELQSLAEQLSIQGRIRFLGFRDDVSLLYDIIDVVVLPSLYEGFPLVALEALERGKALVATSVAGTTEIVKHLETGLLVPTNDAIALAKSIVLLLREDRLALRLGASGKAFVQTHFSIERMVAEYDRAYSLLCSRIR